MTTRKVTPMPVPFRTDTLLVTLQDDFRQHDLEALIETTNAVLNINRPHAEIFQDFFTFGQQLVYCRSEQACAIIQRHLLVRRVRFEAADIC